MNHLMKMITNEVDHELKSRKYVRVSKNARGGHNQKRIAYNINGFWFCLTRMNWASYCGVEYSTIVGRHKAHKSPAIILGYETVDRKYSPGRPRKK